MAYIGTSPANGVRRKHTYTATAGQTSFSGADDNNVTLTYVDTEYLDVYQNGVKLVAVSDYASTTGTSVVLVQGASVNDTVEIIVFDVFSVADTVSAGSGGSFGGNIGIGGTLAVTGIATFTDDIIIGDGKTIGSASKVDAITIAASGNTQLRSTGIAAGSQVFQIIDDGTTVLNVRSEDGNINFPVAGGGVYLGVTAAASSNLLNDYEEGTWTPSFTNVNSGATGGTYTKIGRTVFCTAVLQAGGTASLNITGLPFTALVGTGQRGGSFFLE